MIIEITCNEDGDTYLDSFETKEQWIKHEMEEVEEEECDLVEYLGRFAKDIKEVDIGYWVGKLVIEGKILVPKIKTTVREIDL